jgi:hypothetical protein
MIADPEPRECRTCAWGDELLADKGIGVSAGHLGGEATQTFTVIMCHRHNEEMSHGDTCQHWRSNHDEREGVAR